MKLPTHSRVTRFFNMKCKHPKLITKQATGPYCRRRLRGWNYRALYSHKSRMSRHLHRSSPLQLTRTKRASMVSKILIFLIRDLSKMVRNKPYSMNENPYLLLSSNVISYSNNNNCMAPPFNIRISRIPLLHQTKLIWSKTRFMIAKLPQAECNLTNAFKRDKIELIIICLLRSRNT